MSEKKASYDDAVIHIPHSSLYIPEDFKGLFVINEHEIEKEHLKMVDRYTDELFSHSRFQTYIVARVSRLLCDVERFRNDKNEIMSQVGMGTVYTHTCEGKLLKQYSNDDKNKILSLYYDPHHEKLTKLVEKSLSCYNKCLIIDGHSFSSRPSKSDHDQDENRADFCIGTDSYHTPKFLSHTAKNYLEEFGYSVAINAPYAGTMVPMKYYQRDKRVSSIMIEINRRLYMDEKSGAKIDAFTLIKKRVEALMEKLYSELK